MHQRQVRRELQIGTIAPEVLTSSQFINDQRYSEMSEETMRDGSIQAPLSPRIGLDQ